MGTAWGKLDVFPKGTEEADSLGLGEKFEGVELMHVIAQWCPVYNKLPLSGCHIKKKVVKESTRKAT